VRSHTVKERLVRSLVRIGEARVIENLEVGLDAGELSGCQLFGKMDLNRAPSVTERRLGITGKRTVRPFVVSVGERIAVGKRLVGRPFDERLDGKVRHGAFYDVVGDLPHSSVGDESIGTDSLRGAKVHLLSTAEGGDVPVEAKLHVNVGDGLLRFVLDGESARAAGGIAFPEDAYEDVVGNVRGFPVVFGVENGGAFLVHGDGAGSGDDFVNIEGVRRVAEFLSIKYTMRCAVNQVGECEFHLVNRIPSRVLERSKSHPVQFERIG